MTLRSVPARLFISMALTLLLALPEATRWALAETPAPAGLNLVIVEGEGAINNIKQRTAREPVVQVEDENRRPVAGAAVLFTLPDGGPGGVFANGSKTLKVLSDANGRAVAKGLRLNEISGKFQIKVEASYQGANTSTTITQNNAVLTTAAKGGMSTAKILSIAAAIGAAAATIIIVATRNRNSDSPNAAGVGR